MDSVYAMTLLVSLVTGSAALVVAVMTSFGWQVRAGVAGLVRPASVAAWVALFVSAAVHLAWGHTPGGAQALSPVAFVKAHLAFVAAAILPSLALLFRPPRKADPG